MMYEDAIRDLEEFMQLLPEGKQRQAVEIALATLEEKYERFKEGQQND